jgi:oligopeptide/dipeptide ABC transporter ATP-binding protein
MPRPSPLEHRPRTPIKGDVPRADQPPSGCRFHPRCPRAEAICAEVVPVLRPLDDGHAAACHFADEFRGVPLDVPVKLLERGGQ